MPDADPRRQLPAVHAVLADSRIVALVNDYGRERVTGWIREAIERARKGSDAAHSGPTGDFSLDSIVHQVQAAAASSRSNRIGRVINATGVILHTGLGRAPLSDAAKSAVLDAAGGCNLEVDLETGDRRHRGYQLLDAWRTLTGCEDALVVNNNAAATLLVLQGLCAGREVIISRGQLIEIGGAFRLPDIFTLSGAKLKEVGTTNRTRLSDYEDAIGPDTAAILHVHPSNYRIIGFTESPEIGELVPLAQARGILAIDDIGSGSLVDVTQYGLPAEPTFPQSLAAGADIVLGSGDKLLGGPQAGVILGRRALIERLRKHPLARALRIDKLTLAALAATLELYLRGEPSALPVHRALGASLESLRARAEAVLGTLSDIAPGTIEIREETAAVGGGSVPGAELPTIVIALRPGAVTAEELSRQLRTGSPAVFPRIASGDVLLDLRSVSPEDDSTLAETVRATAIQCRVARP